VAKKQNDGGSLVSALLARTGKVSKNYVVFGTLEKVNGRMPILIGNDGTCYVEASLAAKIPADKAIAITVVIE